MVAAEQFLQSTDYNRIDRKMEVYIRHGQHRIRVMLSMNVCVHETRVSKTWSSAMSMGSRERR